MTNCIPKKRARLDLNKINAFPMTHAALPGYCYLNATSQCTMCWKYNLQCEIWTNPTTGDRHESCRACIANKGIYCNALYDTAKTPESLSYEPRLRARVRGSTPVRVASASTMRIIAYGSEATVPIIKPEATRQPTISDFPARPQQMHGSAPGQKQDAMPDTFKMQLEHVRGIMKTELKNIRTAEAMRESATERYDQAKSMEKAILEAQDIYLGMRK